MSQITRLTLSHVLLSMSELPNPVIPLLSFVVFTGNNNWTHQIQAPVTYIQSSCNYSLYISITVTVETHRSTCSSSVVTLTRLPTSPSSSWITDVPFDMFHLVSGANSLFVSDSLIQISVSRLTFSCTCLFFLFLITTLLVRNQRRQHILNFRGSGNLLKIVGYDATWDKFRPTCPCKYALD